ncbi:hypothetical protein ES708_30136 [subsurface metagenome]
MSEKRGFKGIFPTVKHFLFGGVKTPKVVYYAPETDPDSEAYKGMNKNYRWFRQDEMVRRCVTVNSYVATMTAGFETELEATDPTGTLTKEQKEEIVKKYSYVKEFVDKINKKVNMDNTLFFRSFWVSSSR